MDNPLHSHLQNLFKRLAILNGLLAHLHNQYENYLPLLEKSFEEQNLDPSLMRVGVALAIRDLTHQAKGFRGYHSVEVSDSQNMAEYQQVLEIVLSRNCGWAIAQGYEAFETFLKDTIATYIQRNNDTIDPAIIKKLTPKNKKTVRKLSGLELSPSDLIYWREGIADARLNNKKILVLIRDKLAPRLGEVEQDNKPTIDFVEWFDIVSEVRHAVTHSNGIIETQKQKSNWTQQTFSQLFPGNVTKDGFELQLTAKTAENNLRLFAEYGYVIFKCLSNVQNYTVDNLAI